MDLEGRGCCREQRAAEAAREAHAFALHICAGGAPQAQGLRVAPEFDADLLQDGLGVVLDDLDGFGVQQLDRRDAATDVAEFRRDLPAASGAARPAVAAAARAKLAEAEALRAGLDARALRPALVMTELYRALLARVEVGGRLTRFDKFRAVIRGLWAGR